MRCGQFHFQGVVTGEIPSNTLLPYLSAPPSPLLAIPRLISPLCWPLSSEELLICHPITEQPSWRIFMFWQIWLLVLCCLITPLCPLAALCSPLSSHHPMRHSAKENSAKENSAKENQPTAVCLSSQCHHPSAICIVIIRWSSLPKKISRVISCTAKVQNWTLHVTAWILLMVYVHKNTASGEHPNFVQNTYLKAVMHVIAFRHVASSWL